MSEEKNTSKAVSLIQKLYHYRLKIDRKGTTIVNLSSLFCVPALLLAPYVCIAGVVISLILGYHINLESEDASAEDIQKILTQAGNTVRKTVTGAVQNIKKEIEKSKPEESAKKQAPAEAPAAAPEAPADIPAEAPAAEPERKPEVPQIFAEKRETTPPVDFGMNEEVVNDLERHMDAFFQGNPAATGYRSAYSATANSVPTLQVKEEAGSGTEPGAGQKAAGTP